MHLLRERMHLLSKQMSNRNGYFKLLEAIRWYAVFNLHNSHLKVLRNI